MNRVMPKLLKVYTHFSRAKEIKCLETGEIIEINENTEFKVVEDEIFTGENLVWSEGKYATITKKCECETCECR